MHHVFANMNDSLNGDLKKYIDSVMFVSNKKKKPHKSLFDPDLLLALISSCCVVLTKLTDSMVFRKPQ